MLIRMRRCFLLCWYPTPRIPIKERTASMLVNANPLYLLLDTWNRNLQARGKKTTNKSQINILAHLRRQKTPTTFCAQVKDLFKTQRDEPSRVAFLSDDTSDPKNANDARSMAVEGTLRSALRMACKVTGKVWSWRRNATPLNIRREHRGTFRHEKVPGASAI